ncbi:proton-coupled folate transporter-like [Montipora capricornis]|uniref:proton-coupled folate transporter-like n=1 Tax=Montipora capricornis TaxID=246305 RepID=UPI0035F13CBB
MPRHNLPVWRRLLTVEPVLFFHAYGLLSAFPLYRQYVYSVLSEQNGFPYKEVTAVDDGLGCQESIIAQNDTLKQLEKEVQSQATRVDLALVFFETIPSLLLAPFWGGWLDKSGRRKPALIFPPVGAMLGTIVILTVIQLKLPLYVMFVGSAISGLSGFLTLLTIAVMSYVADTTEKTAIAFRLAIMQLTILSAGFLSQLTSGLWIERFGFIAPAWLIFACFTASALWVIFLVPENYAQVSNEKNKFFDLQHLKRLVNVFKVPRPGGSRRILLLLLLTGVIATLTEEGMGGVVILYIIKTPLCFSPSLVGYFLAYALLTPGIGGAVGVKLFGTFFSEKITGGIGLVSQIIEMTLLSFATRTWLVFLAPGLAVFKHCLGPIVIGILSRTVGEDEQGSLFCAYGLVTMVCQFAGASIFNYVYEATLSLGFNGFVFLVSVAIKLIPLGIICGINIPSPTQDGAEKMRANSDQENGIEQKTEPGESKNTLVVNNSSKCSLEMDESPEHVKDDGFADSTKL